MDKRVAFQAAALAALAAFIGVLTQVGASLSLPTASPAQPSFPVPLETFVSATNGHADTVLTFFAGDSLFILGYLLVFIGLYVATEERARSFALVGLGAGLFTALLDATENAFFITYALNAKSGIPLTNPDLPLIYIVANLKWMAAFATLLAFGVIFPRRNRLEWVIVAIILLFPVVGVIGVAVPSLIPYRGLFFLVGMPVFAWYFWQQSVKLDINPGR